MPKGITRGEYEPRPPEGVVNQLMNSNSRLTSSQIRLLSKAEHWEREARIAKLNPKTLTRPEKDERDRAMKAIAMRRNLKNPAYRKKQNKKTMAWKAENPEKARSSSKNWANKTKSKRKFLKGQQDYREKNRINSSLYRQEQPEKYRKGLKIWRSKNTDYAKNRYHSNLSLRLLIISRERIKDFLQRKGEKKNFATAQYLGCDSETFREHITSRFSDGMTMEKVLRGEIEIHHRIPPGRIMHDCPQNFLKSLHYTNTEPLWKSENRKRSKFIWPDVALEAIRWGIRLKPFEIQRALEAGIKLPDL